MIRAIKVTTNATPKVHAKAKTNPINGVARIETIRAGNITSLK